MFTGIIEQTAEVIEHAVEANSSRLAIASPFEHITVGESIAVNGVCLTVLPSPSDVLLFDISPETRKVTDLAALSSGDLVNLERAMSASSRFGGHYVSGHVDALAHISSIKALNHFVHIELSGFTKQAMLYLIPKGSITVDGISLTINAVDAQSIQLMLVPHTLEHTTLGRAAIGQNVHIEFDYLTRIVAHQLHMSGKLNCEVA